MDMDFNALLRWGEAFRFLGVQQIFCFFVVVFFSKRSHFRGFSWSVSGPTPLHLWSSLRIRLFLGGLAIRLSRQQNHIIFLPIDDHCHQTSSCPITSLDSAHSLSSCCLKPTPPSILRSLIQSLEGSPPPSLPQHPLTIPPTRCPSLDLLTGRKPGLK